MIETHPDPEQLAAFRLGKLAEAELEEIERHVAECDSCCRSLKTLPDDSFVSLVQKATGSTLAHDSTPGADKGAPTWDQAETVSPQVVEVPPDLRDHPRYEILEKLGQGGMGVVYKARHRLMNRVVALKVIHPRLVTNRATVERFRRELMGAARSGHPNIVSALDAERAGETLFLVLEYFPGVSLARVVEEHRPLPVSIACDYIRQAALGLQHAFDQGMVHRDIKPQNLMVLANPPSPSGRGVGGEGAPPVGLVKILDFGLARFVSETANVEPTEASPIPSADAPSLTQASTLMGTPDYIAPEQAQSASCADIRADIYSLGCTFYYLLAGHAPFPNGSAVQKVKAHLEEAPRPVSEIRPEVPADLVRVLDKMLAKDPAQRYQRPAEVAEALAQFTKSEPEASARVAEPAASATVPPPVAHASGPVRRRPRLALAACLAIAACTLAFLFVPPLQQFAQTVIRIATNEGVLEIEADDEDLEITVKQAGKVAVAEVLNKNTKRVYELTAVDGEIDAKLPDGTRLKTTQFKLTRGGRQEFSAKMLLTAPVAGPNTEPGWVQLFNGKDLKGWGGGVARTGPAVPWIVEEGALVGSSRPDGFLNILPSDGGNYHNFHLRVEAKVHEGGSAGVWFRCPDAGLAQGHGYQTSITGALGPDKLKTGGLRRDWGEAGDAKSMFLLNAKNPLVPADQWFTLEVIAQGTDITLKVNGNTVGTARDDTYNKGHILLQALDFHPGPGPQASRRIVRFRKIEIKELPPSAPESAFQPLFNAKDLDGWEGDTKSWSADKGELAGEHGFIQTKQSFENYELRLQFRVSPAQTIKPPPQSPTLWLDLEDRGKNAPTAGIGITLTAQGGLGLTPAGGVKFQDYKEIPLTKPIRIVDWNDLRITRKDGKIALYVNGQLRASGITGAPKRGSIGLQTGFDKLHIRNIDIRNLSPQPEPAFVPLFNGKDLSGWVPWSRNKAVDSTQAFSINANVLMVEGRQQHCYLRTEKAYENYELKFEFRVPPLQKNTAGPMLFLHLKPGEWSESLLSMDPNGTGFIMASNRKDLEFKPQGKPRREGEWNEVLITCKGHAIGVRFNGENLGVSKGEKGDPSKGFIAIVPEFNEVHYRNVQIRALPPNAAQAESGVQPANALDRDDLDKLKGQWLVSLGELGDKPLPAKDFEKLEIRFGTNDFEIVKPGQNPDRLTGTFKVEAAKKRIILQFKMGTRGVPCSYRFDGDRLRLDFEGLLALDTMVGNIGDRLRLAERSRSLNNLKQIALAMHNYHEVHMALPAAAFTNLQAKDGKPLLSWRVALLPFLEEKELYDSFKLDEPWDSPHNKKLIAKMPATYAAPGIKTKEAGQTHYQVFVGPGTAFEPRKNRAHGIRFAEISDGTASTFLLVEAAEPVFWTKPDDLPFDAKQPLAKLGVYGEGIHVAFCDGATATLPHDIADKTLRALITRNGGEQVSAPVLQPDPPQGPRLRLEFRRRTDAEKLQGK